MKGTKLTKVNGTSVQTKDDVIRAIDRTHNTNIFQFASQFQTPIHPETGTTQITFDQFVTIAKHHQDIRNSENKPKPNIDHSLLNPVINKIDTPNLTRSKLIKQDDWDEWENAEKQQLDLYETQQMFSNPTKLPNEHGLNVLAMIWVYLVKTCGRKKAHRPIRPRWGPP